MDDTGSRGDRLYRLVLGDDAHGAARIIEFKAAGAYSTLLVAERRYAGRRVEVFEDGRSLGSIRSHSGGYWVISPRVSSANVIEITRAAKRRQPVPIPDITKCALSA